ncbi:astakine-like [Athalia rosae]|uniref:astakine-like n=1 Tax=Athalia rosae TaxID=37344 RepID=UPI0020342533|nr:astakine-like [Athalia rosae]XP_012261299.2 astakine-like [Athalia rosae]XP_020709782.2 astakine-like [Athalia rosae]XP_048506059.1 astakine-like [Athalia rosae]
MTQSLTFAAIVVIVGICQVEYTSARVTMRPPYIQCQSNSECLPGNCCSIGQNRFSIPQCKPMQDQGGVCRPRGPMTSNTTLVYPDGSQVQLVEVHIGFCPCGYGLTCNPEEGLCRDPSQRRGFNSLLDEASVQDD